MSSVQIRDVRKSFGNFEVLHGVSIPIEEIEAGIRNAEVCLADHDGQSQCMV